MKRKWALAVFLCLPGLFCAQDTLRYSVSTVQASASHFHVSSVNPQAPGFSPSAIISVKSFATDSLGHPHSKIHFMVMLGGAQSRFVVTDPKFLRGLYDKSNFYVLSQRVFG